MAVNKNFVVKNGIEVAENLVFASSDLEKVGIGSTVPTDTLDVRGGIAATNFYAAGVVTSTDNFYVGASGTVFTALTGFGSVGVGTANPIFPLDIRSSASTGTTALYVYGDMRVTGDINLDDITLDDVNATDLNVSGLSTLTGNVVLAGSVNQLNVSGISTFSDDVIINEYNFNYSKEEIEILKKISQWPKCVEISSNKLEPHRVPVYLYELAQQFHHYWNLGKEDETKRFISKDKTISEDKIAILKGVSIVIKSGMDILGVSTPERM